jgi:hypothetical protein
MQKHLPAVTDAVKFDPVTKPLRLGDDKREKK